MIMRKKRKTQWKKKRKYYRFLLFLLLNSIIIVIITQLESSHVIQIGREVENSSIKLLQTKSVHDENFYSKNVILINLQNNNEIINRNGDQKIYPASMTKIMSAIVAIECIEDLQSTVTLSSDIFEYLYSQNASMAGFLPNEEVTVMDLLYGVMLPSGADATIGLANYVAGSESAFIELMNQKAKELGMKRTHFNNSCGFYQKDHYSTVEDISILLKYALQNPIFREIFTSKRHSINSTNMHIDGITIYSTLFQRLQEEIGNVRILGGKTGYTSEAGLCLASLAEKEGIEYILVTAAAPGNNKTEPLHIMDAEFIYENYLR